MASSPKSLRLPCWAYILLVLLACFALPIDVTGDVPDVVVYTNQTVQLGDRAVLKCQFNGTPFSVSWKKGIDPTTATNLITWVDGKNDSGSCVHDETCEMNSDYSLTIKNVIIADQGLYICRVFNFKGNENHDSTDLTVYAAPEEPYPFINECKENEQNCSVSVQSPINITCTASRYFPDIDLIFLHGVQKVLILETVEWKNDDGTKSKFIITTASPSNISYVCMAFNIPGSQDERTATISVPDHHANTTLGSGDQPEIYMYLTLFLKIALPVAASVVVVYSLTRLVKRILKKLRRRENGTDEERRRILAAQRGKISHYELWFLAGNMTKSKADKDKLHDILKHLKITADIREGQLTQLEAYQVLCEWKQENREVNQAENLEEALITFHFGDEWTKMMEEKGEKNSIVSKEAWEHILWTIDGIEKVNRFLSELIPNRERIDANEKREFVVEVALGELNAWSRESLELNPIVLMSLALENAGCTPIEKLLFTVPENLKAPLQDDEKTMREFTDKLTGRHCKRLAMTLHFSEQKKIDDYISRNHHYVFDTRSLIAEWLHEVECSNYEKRCRLDDAVIGIGRYDLHDFFKTLVYRQNAEQPSLKSYYFDHESIFDDDITQLIKLVKWLPPDKKTKLKKKFGLRCGKDDDDNTLKKQMEAWRDRITTTSSDTMSIDQSLKEFQSLRKELINNTTYTELTLTDEEIEAVSSHVISADKQQELTSKIHIVDVCGQKDSFVGKLKRWRNAQAKANCRVTLQKALEQIGLAECIVSKSPKKQLDQEELHRIALKLMMEDVCPIIDALGIDQEKVKSYVRKWNNTNICTTGLLMKLKKESRNREDFCKALRNVGFIDIARSVYFGENV